VQKHVPPRYKATDPYRRPLPPINTIVDMKRLLNTIIILTICCLSYSQDLELIRDSILNEGLNIYKLEKVAWLGTDKLNINPLNNYLINGYVPYYEKDSIRTIFYYHDSFGTRIRFTASYYLHDSLSIDNIVFKAMDRTPTNRELLIIEIRDDLENLINTSSAFTQYTNYLNYNVSLIDNDTLLHFYILPASSRNDLFYLGGDYIITYSSDKKLVSVNPQHKRLLEIKPPHETVIKSFTHTHIEGFSDFITATDICQAKLYGKIATNCTTFIVITEGYESTYNTETDELTIIKVSNNWR